VTPVSSFLEIFTECLFVYWFVQYYLGFSIDIFNLEISEWVDKFGLFLNRTLRCPASAYEKRKNDQIKDSVFHVEKFNS
jgi:hypothetical protein